MSSDSSQMSPKIFQIGFNKTATTALFWLFINSGHSALHSNGRRSKRAGHPVISRCHPQLTIHHNICAGLPPVTGLEDFDAFFDMEYDRPNSPVKIENFKFFDRFAIAYPNARFILNTRDKDSWLRSRQKHNDGRYIERSMERLGLSEDQVLDYWRDEYDRHHEAVRTFFENERDRLFEFEIKTTPIQELIDFCAPEFSLNSECWGHSRVTPAS